MGRGKEKMEYVKDTDNSRDVTFSKRKKWFFQESK
jgi:hypothetical protein